MGETLHVFAVNEPLTVRHTYLTRMQGEAPSLPPLTDWAGMRINPDLIELFPVKDLAGISLSSYLETAFAVLHPSDPDHARRLDALTGHVLLVLAEPGVMPKPTSALTLIASLETVAADSSPMHLPKADARGASAAGGAAVPTSPVVLPGWLIALALGFIALIGLIVLL